MQHSEHPSVVEIESGMVESAYGKLKIRVVCRGDMEHTTQGRALHQFMQLREKLGMQPVEVDATTKEG